MDRPRLSIGRLFLGTLLVLGLAFLIFSPEPRITREGATVDFVERTVHLSVQTVHARLASGLEREAQSHRDFGGPSLMVADYGSRGFPTLYQMRDQLGTNPGLSRYAGLGETAWKQDFSVKAGSAGYRHWFSEYLNNGQPVPFSTDFLIHLEPLGTYDTRIEVIEYAPKVIVGTKFRLCGRHLFPEVSNDTRPVAPTTKDRHEMLDLVLQVAKPGLPGLADEGCYIGGTYVDSDGGVHIIEEIDAGAP